MGQLALAYKTYVTITFIPQGTKQILEIKNITYLLLQKTVHQIHLERASYDLYFKVTRLCGDDYLVGVPLIWNVLACEDPIVRELEK